MAPSGLVVQSFAIKLTQLIELVLRAGVWLPWGYLLFKLVSKNLSYLNPNHQNDPINLWWYFLISIGFKMLGIIFDARHTDYFAIAEDLDHSDESKLQPKFFFSTSRHTRLNPSRYLFQYPILYVGMTTKFVDTIGCLFSVKRAERERENPSKDVTSKYGNFTFFNVDPKNYMNSELGFDDKIREYLRSNGIDDSYYPHIYLITSPSFLWCHFNPVTYWYIYTKDYQLAYTVLEVSNTFSESHAYILPREGSEQRSRDFLYTHRFSKTFHISPFNKRSGEYEADVSDVVAREGQDIKIAVLDDDGSRRMTVRTWSIGAPLDMLEAGVLDIILLISRWAFSGALFIPRALMESFRILAMKGIQVFTRPEPQLSSKSRHASSLERNCQNVFLTYLQDSLGRCTTPVDLVLTLPRHDIGITPEIYKFGFHGASNGLETECLEVNVKNHIFWFKLLANTTFAEFYQNEIAHVDPDLRCVEVSDWNLLLDILDRYNQSNEAVDHNGSGSYLSMIQFFGLNHLLNLTGLLFNHFHGESLETSPLYLYYRYTALLPYSETGGNVNEELSEPNIPRQCFKIYSITMFHVTCKIAALVVYQKSVAALKVLGYDLDWLPSQ